MATEQSANDCSTTISRVFDLRDDSDEDEAPTPRALKETVELLYEVSELVGGSFPRASASTTVDGGIHIYWKRPGRILKLSIPAREGESGFIYHEDNQRHAAERDISAQALAEWIRWFNNA